MEESVLKGASSQDSPAGGEEESEGGMCGHREPLDVIAV